MSKNKQLFLHSSPLILGVVLSYLFWKTNYLLLALYLLITLLFIWLGKDRGAELKILSWGIVWGFIIEIIGTQISGYQSFTNPDLLGIPYWLPVSWGYGFVLMKRISLILAAGSPWTRKIYD